MNTAIRLAAICLIFANSLTTCSLARRLQKMTPIIRAHGYSAALIKESKANKHLEELNSRLIAFTGNIFRNSSVDLSTLKQSLEDKEGSREITKVVNLMFDEGIKSEKNNERKKNLEVIRKHMHKMIEERDENLAS